MQPIIYSVFPKEYSRYIEIFGGSGAVLLGREPVKFEVYNDVDGELVNCFRVIRNLPAELLLELDLLPLNSRRDFNRWLHFHDGENDPAVYFPTQELVLDTTVPKAWAEELKVVLRRREDYELHHVHGAI